MLSSSALRWLMVNAPGDARWTCVVAEIFCMVGLGSSGLFPAQSMEGLGLSQCVPRLVSIPITGEGFSWNTGPSATTSAHCGTDGAWRYHNLKNVSPRSLLLSPFPSIMVCTSNDTVKGLPIQVKCRYDHFEWDSCLP